MPDRLYYWLHSLFLPNSLRTMEWRMLKLVNQDRKYHNLSTLKMQNDLRLVARNHSFHMAEQDFFAHVDPAKRDPGDRIREAGITDTTFGENLAKMRGFDHVTDEAEKALMKSPGHRANILYKDFNCVGIGVIQAKDETYYFTQNFARRFLRLNWHKLYVKYAQEIQLKAQTLSPFASITVRERYQKPFRVNYKVHNNEVLFTLVLEERGRYELEFLVQPQNDNQMYVSNILRLRACESFWDRFWI
jgi:hypothetical protein